MIFSAPPFPVIRPLYFLAKIIICQSGADFYSESERNTIDEKFRYVIAFILKKKLWPLVTAPPSGLMRKYFLQKFIPSKTALGPKFSDS